MSVLTKRFAVTKQALLIILVSVLILAVLILVGILKTGSRAIDPLTTIHGIPYPETEQGIIITENLTHADIKLLEPVLAKKLKLTVTFTPHEQKSIQVSIRSKAFWLSYPWVNIKDQSDNSSNSPITKTITVPLTDKFQEPDRSIDLMFFAPTNGQTEPGQGVSDTTHFLIHDIQAEVSPARPTLDQLIDYLASLFLRERAV